jgi:fumarate reductase subunit D
MTAAPRPTMPRTTAPLWWLLFSAGGVASALLMPVAIAVTGIAVPAGWVSASDLLEVVRHPVTRLVVFGLVSLSLFHWAHRFRYALTDLGLARLGRQAWLFYGIAALGTVVIAVLVVRL